jgi:hypothetical protein
MNLLVKTPGTKPDQGFLPEVTQEMEEKRKSVAMVQRVYDELGRQYHKKYGLHRDLVYLQTDFENLVELIECLAIPITAIEAFCERFKEITATDLHRFLLFEHIGDDNEVQETAGKKLGWASEPLGPFIPALGKCTLPGIKAKPFPWKGIKRSLESLFVTSAQFAEKFC